ncbi:hypothetical protein PIB30_065390, partial [Stylosanthes scabra]|nr:hypothetical protein [Stylosanthes scabra]
PRAYPTLYDVENTKQRNWALHVHNFLLEELKKAKENKTKLVHGCCYALLIICFHETHFGKNSREPIAQPPWIDYWNGRTLWDRMKQEKRDVAVKTDIEGYVPDESEKDTDSGLQQGEDNTLAETMRRIRKRKNEEKEERNNKKKKQPHGKSPANVEPDHEPPQQPRQLEEEETPIQQPEPQPQQQLPQDDVIDLSSCSDDEQPPHHMDVVHPLVPKVEKLQENQPPPVLEQPSQSVVEVV